jgi:flagellar L-ring protein FlgH
MRITTTTTMVRTAPVAAILILFGSSKASFGRMGREPGQASASASASASGQADRRPQQPRDEKDDPKHVPSAGSLWTGATNVDLASDLRARAAGDLVTIRIVETTTAKQAAATDSTRDSSATAGVDALFGLQNYAPSNLGLDHLLGFSSSNQFKGGGANSRSNLLTATITAQVIDVLPNRNLVVEASRVVQINGEEERLTLRGILRPADVGSDNAALSTSLAGVQILYGGKGVIGSNLSPGLLHRVLRFLL